MTKLIGAVIFAIGAFLVWGAPLTLGYFNNFEIGKYRIYGERVGHVPVSQLSLGRIDTPISITATGMAEIERENPGATTELQITIFRQGDDGRRGAPVFLSPMRFQLAETGGEAGQATRATEPVTLPSIISLEDGLYGIETSDGTLSDLKLTHVDITLTGRATGDANGYAPTGYALIIGGGVVFFFGLMDYAMFRSRDDDDDDDDDYDDDDDDDDDDRRKKKRRRRTSEIGRRMPVEAPKPKEKEPAKPTRKWGRGDAE